MKFIWLRRTLPDTRESGPRRFNLSIHFLQDTIGCALFFTSFQVVLVLVLISYLIISSVISARFSPSEFTALAVMLLAFVLRYYKTANLCHKAFASIKAVKRQIILEPLDSDNQVSISPTAYEQFLCMI